jgi:RNA polymerase sigma factor (sigma-70 family)
MTDDGELLRRYHDERSEEAFTELVQRHVNLVYFAALRRVGDDAHLADDVTQKVFADLARKAASLKDRSVLAGWLYTSTRFVAAQTVRSERRRRNHEQEAHTMHELHSASEPDWDRLRPMIDEAMDELNEREREALLLRFFENRPLAEVGAKFSLSPDAARMRVDRALEKLGRLLAKRGLASTSAALAAAFVTQSALAAPAGLVMKIAAGTLSQIGTSTAGTLTLWKILTSITIAGVGLGLAVYEVRRIKPSVALGVAASSSPEAILHAPASPVVVSEVLGKTIAEPTKVTNNLNQSGKATGDLEWSQVGLFAGDANKKPNHTIKQFREKMKEDAAFRARVLGRAKERLDLFYGYLFRWLALPESQLDQFKSLLVEKEQLKIETLEAQNAVGLLVRENRGLFREGVDLGQQKVDAEIKALLGEARNMQYLQYREDLVQWSAVNALAHKLRVTATPLTDEQANKLVVLLRSSLLRIHAPFTFDISIGAGFYSGHIGSALTERVFRQSAEFLSPPQVESFRRLQRPRSFGSSIVPMDFSLRSE